MENNAFDTLTSQVLPKAAWAHAYPIQLSQMHLLSKSGLHSTEFCI